ncbi:hypothetical protein HJC04_14010 [Rhizobium sp. NLR8a]|uniref:hypothetical protein n=1 Tax=Rhizobium sp. NLR8a TaxID=2731119 RepID=UPI001C82E69C|nr:hypothetical protein [Rhizobium sp. NLR8a]MBX5221423.1 hypothetical protein [Rhizobium sp. NLR8a]
MARAAKSGRVLSLQDASLVKGMIRRGDRHHDIAAWFGVNQGRIAEVNDGHLHPTARIASADQLPPPGPYSSGQAAYMAITALEEAKLALETAAKNIEQALKGVKS